MTMQKCAKMGCDNPVGRMNDVCSGCESSDLSYGINGY